MSNPGDINTIPLDVAAQAAARLNSPLTPPDRTPEWTPQFTAAGDYYIPARVAMRIDQMVAKLGTGTIVYTKSTAAAPGTFGAATLPVDLEAGAWLKVTASAITGFVAVHLKRTH